MLTDMQKRYGPGDILWFLLHGNTLSSRSRIQFLFPTSASLQPPLSLASWMTLADCSASDGYILTVRFTANHSIDPQRGMLEHITRLLASTCGARASPVWTCSTTYYNTEPKFILGNSCKLSLPKGCGDRMPTQSQLTFLQGFEVP
jgi:hypothetical protein